MFYLLLFFSFSNESKSSLAKIGTRRLDIEINDHISLNISSKH